MSKLSYEQRISIYNERKQGTSISTLSKKYNVRENVIQYMVCLIDKHGIDILRKNKNMIYPKYKKEEIIHSLICPMKHSSNDIPFEEMNLWIVDERLSFHNYLASDQELKSIPAM